MIKNPPPWPNGARCAVAFSFDVDADSVVHVAHGGRIVDEQHAIAQMRYDPFVALPRLVDLFGAHAIPITCFVPGWVARTYPEQVAYILKQNNEIGHHGHLHDWPNQQSLDEEREALDAGIRHLEALTGRRPVGYRAPYYGVSRNTYDLLIEAGFDYDSSLFADDVPIVLTTKNGYLVEIPIPASVDDYNQYVSGRAFDYLMKVSSPWQALEVYRAEFDAMWEFGGLWVSCWHPAVSGRPGPVLAVRALIEHMLEKGQVWFATHAAVAEHVRSLVAAGTWIPRTEQVPLYREAFGGHRD